MEPSINFPTTINLGGDGQIVSLLHRRSERTLKQEEDPKPADEEPDLISRLAAQNADKEDKTKPVSRQPSLLKNANNSSAAADDASASDTEVEINLITRRNSFVKESLLDQNNGDDSKRRKSRFKKFAQRYMKSIPAWEKKLNEMETIGGAILRFLDSYFRGVSQIAFVNNPIVGIGTLIIALITDTWIGTCGILGCFCTTLFAATGNLKKEIFRAGLFGFNGYLLGAIMAVFILSPWDWRTVVIIVVLSPISIISQIAFSHIFVAFDSPAFGLPLLLVVNFFFLATYESGYLHPVSYVPQFPQVVDAVQEVRVDIVFESIGRCITRAFFTSNPWSALAFLLLLLIYTPWHAIAAVTGGVLNTLTLYLLGVNSEFIATGLWGWNSTLISLALFGEFLRHSWRSWIYTAYAVILTTIFQVGCAPMFKVIGIPETSLPFSLLGVVFMAARKSLPSLKENLVEQVPVDSVAARRQAFSRRRAVSRFMKL